MADIAVAQEVAWDIATGDSQSFASVTINGVTAGSSLHVIAACPSSATVSGCADDRSSSFGAAKHDVVDTTNTQRVAHWAADGVASGSHVVTVTLSGAVDYRGICVREIVNTSGYDVGAGQFQNAPGTGTDAVTSGTTAALAAAASLVSGATANTSGAGAASIGTGFSIGDNTQWPNAGPLTTEHKRVTGSTGQAATFTVASDRQMCTVVAVFKETAAGGGIADIAYYYSQEA